LGLDTVPRMRCVPAIVDGNGFYSHPPPIVFSHSISSPFQVTFSVAR
jgi:hypothetical protein